jgi:hypothetical protein
VWVPPNLPPCICSGRLSVFINAIDEANHYIKFHLCNKSNDFKWTLVVVFGPAQDEWKGNFLAELVHICNHENLPLLMGGYYNILRHPSKKIMTALMLDGHFCVRSSLMILISMSYKCLVENTHG